MVYLFSFKIKLIRLIVWLPKCLLCFFLQCCTLFSFLKKKILLSEYTTFANIEITETGFRRLFLHGYMFGEAKSKRNDSKIRWRCTGGWKNEHNKRVRCNAQLITCVLNGYEMIKSVQHIMHQHWYQKNDQKHNFGISVIAVTTVDINID